MNNPVKNVEPMVIINIEFGSLNNELVVGIAKLKWLNTRKDILSYNPKETQVQRDGSLLPEPLQKKNTQITKSKPRNRLKIVLLRRFSVPSLL